jgi:hypothetical protein
LESRRCSSRIFSRVGGQPTERGVCTGVGVWYFDADFLCACLSDNAACFRPNGSIRITGVLPHCQCANGCPPVTLANRAVLVGCGQFHVRCYSSHLLGNCLQGGLIVGELAAGGGCCHCRAAVHLDGTRGMPCFGVYVGEGAAKPDTGSQQARTTTQAHTWCMSQDTVRVPRHSQCRVKRPTDTIETPNSGNGQGP